MRIAVITLSASRNAGGLFYSVRALATRYQAEGHQVTVLCIKDTNISQDVDAWGDVPVISFAKTVNSKYGFSLGMLAYILKHKFDVIHLNGIWNFSSIVALFGVLFSSAQLVISPRGMLDEWILSRKAIVKKIHFWLFEARLIRRVKYIHALCLPEKQSIAKIVPHAKVSVYPNGVFIEHKNAYQDKPNTLPRRLIYIGRYHEKKNLELLIQAWLACNSHSDWLLDIYGWGDEDYIIRLKNIAQGTPSVTVHGALYGEEKDKVLLNASAFILPSLSEGLPMAVLEAMAAANLILMSEYCNLPDELASGLAIDCGITTESIGVALQTLFSLSTDVLVLKQQASYERAASVYQWDALARNMLLEMEAK